MVQTPSISIVTSKVSTPQVSTPLMPVVQVLMPQTPATPTSMTQTSTAPTLMPLTSVQEVLVPNFLTSNAAEHSRVAVHSLLSLKSPAKAVQSYSSTPMGGNKSVAKAVAHVQMASAHDSLPMLGPSLCGDEQSSFNYLCSLSSSGSKSIVCSQPSIGEPTNSHHKPKRIRLEDQSGNSPTTAATGSSGAPIQVKEADEEDIMEIDDDDNDDDDNDDGATVDPASGMTMTFPPVPIPPIGDPLLREQINELNSQRAWYYYRDHTLMQALRASMPPSN